MNKIRAAQRHLNFANWSSAQNAYLLVLANSDPEKPNTELSPIQFLPYPEAMQELENTVKGKLSPKILSEIKKAYDENWFGLKLSMHLYASFLR